MKKSKAKGPTVMNERQYDMIEKFVVSGLDSNEKIDFAISQALFKSLLHN